MSDSPPSERAVRPEVVWSDPFTLRAWAGIEVEGLPDLGEQGRLMGEHVLPQISAL